MSFLSDSLCWTLQLCDTVFLESPELLRSDWFKRIMPGEQDLLRVDSCLGQASL